MYTLAINYVNGAADWGGSMSVVRQWMAAYRAAVPLAQLPLPRL